MRKQPARKRAGTVPQPPPARPAAGGWWDPAVRWKPALLLALLGLGLYLNTIGYGYTVDDDTVMAKNEIVKKGVKALPEIFTTRYRAGFWERKENMYRPLSLAMFAVEWQISPDNPVAGHAVNIALYALTAWLLFSLLCRMLPGHGTIIPFVATLLFVTHPLHTEVIANIKSRDEILVFLFSLLSLKASLSYAARRRPAALAASALCFFLALLSKENAVMLLILVPLTLYFFTPFTKAPVRAIVIAFAGVAALYFVLRASVLGGLAGQTELLLVNNSLLGAGDTATRVASAIRIMGKYLLLLVFPHPLVFDYSYDQIGNVGFGNPLALVSLAVIVALLARAAKGFRGKDPVSFGILFFGVSVALVSNIFFLIESTMAERFLYMPSMGFCLVAAVSGKRLLGKQVALLSAAVAVAALFSVKTVVRNTCWKDNITLLSADVVTSPKSARIRYAFGSALLFERALVEDDPVKKEQWIDQAILHLERGVSILNTYADAYFHLGLAYTEKGDAPKAIQALESARKLKVYNTSDFHAAMGAALGLAGRYADAVTELKEALALDSTAFNTLNNMGIYLTDGGDPQSAIPYLETAHRLKPDNEKALYNLGNAHARAGDYLTAVDCYKQAVNINDRYEDAYNNIGNSYAAMKEFAKAIPYYEKVLALNPGNRQALNNLGITYKMIGDDVNGDRYLKQAGIQ